jgi:hypothetical protein
MLYYKDVVKENILGINKGDKTFENLKMSYLT